MRVSRILESYGDRIQKSVFELPMGKKLMELCESKIMRAIDPRSDIVNVYRLCRSCDSVRRYHGAPVRRIGEEKVFVV